MRYFYSCLALRRLRIGKSGCDMFSMAWEEFSQVTHVCIIMLINCSVFSVEKGWSSST